MLINIREKVGTKQTKNPKRFIDYSQTTDDVYKNLEVYNPTRERKVLKVFDDMTADMKTNKKLTRIYSYWIFLQRRKHFTSFNTIILCQSA